MGSLRLRRGPAEEGEDGSLALHRRSTLLERGEEEGKLFHGGRVWGSNILEWLLREWVYIGKR